MRDRWLVAIAAVGVVVMAGWTAFVVSTDRPLDYYTYVIAADVLSRGENVFTMAEADYTPVARRLGITNYAPPYRYPLLTALAVLPLTYLPLRIGAALWVFASGLAGLAAAWRLGLHAPQAWQRRLILLAMIGYVPLLTTMNAGQVNAFPLLCTAAALHAWREARDARAGAWLALGLWFKPFAFALPALALWRTRWQTVIGIAIASAVIVLVGLPVFGVNLSIAQFEVFAGYQGIAALPIPTNQNLTGLLSRWLTRNDFGTPLIDAPGWLAPARYALTALILAVVAWALWPPTQPGAKRNSGARMMLEAALLISATHLLFTQTWYHHLAMLFIAFAALVAEWPDWRRPTPQIVVLGIAYVLIDLHGLIWKNLIGHTLLLDGATWAQVAILIMLVATLRRPTADSV
ncbi:MAG: DUF2029 domain-containing protein [Chloroflexi bacterium]|nr:DUF2029 domain-containing protein [Chloroflexota bacterium]